ncbi:methyltransferase [Chloroflexota bacterium]
MSQAAQSLILEYLHPQHDARILAMEGGDGWLASEVARLIPNGRVLSLARDIREVHAAKTRLSAIPNASSTQDVFPKTKNWDIVLLTIPKERRYARTLLLAAWGALKPGGKLFLAGPSKGGAKAVIKDAERLFGNSSVLGYRSHQRVAISVREDTFITPLPKEFQQGGIAPDTQHVVELHRSGRILKLETHPGIFSWDAVDEGTALLLDHLEVEPGSRVWDVGCGYGAIGLSAVLAGAGFAAMSDINLLAVDYAQRNAYNLGMEESVKVFAADTVSFHPDTDNNSHLIHPFSLIISNPAFHQGPTVDKSMADQLIILSPDFLAPSGRLLIVANRFLNYDKFMREHFTHVARIAENSKFHLIQAHNS